MPEKLVAVIMLNWNRVNDTIACIKSILAGDYKNLKFFVVDNGSNDKNEVGQIIKAFEDISVLSLPDNLGFTGGMNAGIKYVMEKFPEIDYFMILDNDMIVDSKCVSSAISVLDSEHDVDVIGAAVYNFNGELQYSAANINFWVNVVLPTSYYFKSKYNETKRFTVTYLSFWCSFVRREVFDVVGLFSDFFIAWDDVDFSWRITKKGMKMIYLPKSKVFHKDTILNNGSGKLQYYGTRNKFIVAQRILPKWQYWLFLLYMFTINLAGLTVYYILVDRNIRRLKHFYKGVDDGYFYACMEESLRSYQDTSV